MVLAPVVPLTGIAVPTVTVPGRPMSVTVSGSTSVEPEDTVPNSRTWRRVIASEARKSTPKSRMAIDLPCDYQRQTKGKVVPLAGWASGEVPEWNSIFGSTQSLFLEAIRDCIRLVVECEFSASIAGRIARALEWSSGRRWDAPEAVSLAL